MFSSPLFAALPEWVESVSVAIDVFAITIIVVGIAYASFLTLYRRLHGNSANQYAAYKATVGRSLLLGLEILVAADVIRTVALDATLDSVAALGLLVVVRTFLSWSINVEIEGRWPWQSGYRAEKVAK